ncbi:MAG: ABC transporter ATP-binding protein, partial [Lacibacter sp.]|nr:ABC transporter ATP-binding protein [Lacibacter sp.]
GSVEDVLVDEDVVEIGAVDMEQLKNVLNNYPGKTTTIINAQTIQLHFPKGTASAEEVNRYCFNHGVALQYLSIKKKRLEERFFELTNN